MICGWVIGRRSRARCGTYDTYVLVGGGYRLLPVQVSAARVDAEGYATVTVSSVDGFKQESPCETRRELV